MSKSSKLSISKMNQSCERVSHLLKSLSHPQRLMILGCLANGESSVADLLKRCEISQSQASQFLVRMKSEGLIQSRAVGKFRMYSIADEKLRKLIHSIHGIYCN